ncbi:hypothetical protein ACLB2K_012239 [Fragaria x ananassa]
MHHRTCGQCERDYHTWCISPNKLESDPKGNWFCSEGCKKIFSGLHECLGKQIPAGHGNLTWSLLKSDSNNTNDPNNAAITETYSKLNLALLVIHECFKPFKQPYCDTDLAEDMIFSRGSDVNQMNFQGFYTMLLERNDELTVATVRIHGAQVAEIPLIGTRFQYQRRGMCRLLISMLEKMLMDLGVERLILPTVSSLLDNWSSFGFTKMTDSQRLQVLDYTFMEFQGTIICQKSLMKIPQAEPCQSKGAPLDVDNAESLASSDDNVSFTWKIDNFSALLCTKKYPDTLLTGQLRWRILLYPKGRGTVDDLSVSFGVEGGSELSLGWSRYAQLSMTMVNQLQGSKSITKETRHLLNKMGSDFGFLSLMSLNELHDLSKGYVVNDTCIIQGNITVHKARIQVSHVQQTGAESVKGPRSSSAACRDTCLKNVTAFQDAKTSEQVCIELSDTDSEPTLEMEKKEVPDISSTTRNATSFQNVPASQGSASSAEIIELSDSSTDHSLEEELNCVSSASPSDLMNFRGLAKIKKEYVPLLEEVCSWHPSLIECQKQRSPDYTKWAFTALGKVLHFLKIKKVKDMTTSVCEELEGLYTELKAFKFDLTWLQPHVETALDMNKYVERAAEVKTLRENVKDLEIESKRLEAELVAVRNDLEKAGQGFEGMTMSSFPLPLIFRLVQRKNHRVKHLAYKEMTKSHVSMSSLSNSVEFGNENGEKEDSASTLKVKRRKLSASSSGYRTDHDGTHRTPVLRSRNRVQDGEKEVNASPLKVKRRKLSASSSGYRTDRDGTHRTPVLRSRN